MAVRIEKSEPYIFVTSDGAVSIRTTSPDRLELDANGSTKLIINHEDALSLAANIEQVVTTWRAEFSKWHRTE